MTSLLPPNATKFERDLEKVIATRLDGIPVPTDQLWNPQSCPAELLPWLAWALSVDEWSPVWSDTQKRGAIETSVAVHQKKGSVYAVKTALDGLGYQIELSEWHQHQPLSAPHSFQATLKAEQSGIASENAYSAIESVINKTKNARSYLRGISVIAQTNGTQYIGAAMYCAETIMLADESGVPYQQHIPTGFQSRAAQ